MLLTVCTWSIDGFSPMNPFVNSLFSMLRLMYSSTIAANFAASSPNASSITFIVASLRFHAVWSVLVHAPLLLCSCRPVRQSPEPERPGDRRRGGVRRSGRRPPRPQRPHWGSSGGPYRGCRRRTPRTAGRSWPCSFGEAGVLGGRECREAFLRAQVRGRCLPCASIPSGPRFTRSPGADGGSAARASTHLHHDVESGASASAFARSHFTASSTLFGASTSRAGEKSNCRRWFLMAVRVPVLASGRVPAAPRAPGRTGARA